MPATKLNQEVSTFLNELNHPLREEIELLRNIILNSNKTLSENIKWNAPNYVVGENDRVTLKINPPKNILIILHRGAKVQAVPAQKLIDYTCKVLSWKTNDRAIITLNNKQDIITYQNDIVQIVNLWLEATKDI
ncbi:MAG: DUF1801 domain-containing protein [Bacteroidia bacterium]